MNTKIDLKSALCGLGVGVLATLGIAATSSPNPIGRYQLGGIVPFYLVIDTATGQVWTFNTQTPGQPTKVTDAEFFQPKLEK